MRPGQTWREIEGAELEELRATHYGLSIGIARAIELADGTLRVLPGRKVEGGESDGDAKGDPPQNASEG